MSSEPLQLSEARRRLSAPVERVARGGRPIAIGRYGRERAVLVGADEYARLAGRAQPRRASVRTIEGTLTLTCSPAELSAESRRLGERQLLFPTPLPQREFDFPITAALRAAVPSLRPFSWRGVCLRRMVSPERTQLGGLTGMIPGVATVPPTTPP